MAKQDKKKSCRVTSIRSNVSSGWDIEPEQPFIQHCDLIKKTYLLLSTAVVAKCHMLMQFSDKNEWLGYLAISREETEQQIVYTAHDLVLPWQLVSGTSVDVCAFPYVDDENIRKATNGDVYLGGVVHSHHGMDIKFSGTDDDFINKNNEVSLLLANSFGFYAEAITKTLCGRDTKQPITVIPFGRDQITTFMDIEAAFREQITQTEKASGYLNNWEYSHPTEQEVKKALLKTVSITTADGTKLIQFGGDLDDTRKTEELVGNID